MYSNNQWSFNPAAYQNIPYEQVDWASLAQQWIKMKETVPTNQGPPPPPAPQISKTAEPTPIASTPTAPAPDIEGGEAPMDMDTKDDETPSVGVASSGNWNQWGNWQSQWGWGWSGNAGTVPLAENQTASVDNKVKSQSNDSIPALSDVRNFPLISNTGTCTPQVPSSFNYNNTTGGIIPPILPKSNFPYENSFKNSDNWSKGGKASGRHPPKSVPAEQFPVIDAAKKKQLPAWIREGLNKMEREKQKKLERERMAHEKTIMDQMKVEVKEEPVPTPAPIYVQVPPPQELLSVPDHRKSPDPKYHQKHHSPVEPIRQRSRMDVTASRKTKDQIMEESMLKVRRILTEILLEATERQVHIIAKEEHRRFRTASAPQIRKSNALTSLTGNLGLDVYDSEDNSSDSDRDKDDDVDSDEELQMIVEKKKRDFTLVEDEIERLIEDQEAKERLIALQDKDEDDNDDDVNEDDEEDEPRSRNNRDKDGSGSHPEEYHRSRRGSTSEIKQLNGDSKPAEETEKGRTCKKSKSTSRSSSSSSSASTSSSFSGHSSSQSTKSDHTGSSNDSKKKRIKHKSRKKNEKKSKSESKTKRRDSSESDSEKRSSSRSRYYDKYKRNRNSDSVERKRHRRSTSYRRRSPSYHRSSRREQSSKYKDSPSHSRRRDYSPDSKRSRYRSSSRESSKHSRYKRR